MSNSIDLKKVKRWCPELATDFPDLRLKVRLQEPAIEAVAHRFQSLRDVVEKYARHTPSCKIGSFMNQCNCGYEEAIAALKGAV